MSNTQMVRVPASKIFPIGNFTEIQQRGTWIF